MLIGFAVLILPVVAVISAVVYGIIWGATRKKAGKKSLWYHLARYALIGYGLSLFYLTIGWYYPDITFQPEYYFLNLRPFVWVTDVYTMGAEKMAEQLILNIGMFVPYGLLLPAVFQKLQKPLRTLGVVLATTVGIETVQYFIGRSADIDDVIMNFFGGVLGYLCYCVLVRVERKKESVRAESGVVV